MKSSHKVKKLSDKALQNAIKFIDRKLSGGVGTIVPNYEITLQLHAALLKEQQARVEG